MKTSKYCPSCKKEFSLDSFGKNSYRRDGLNIYCKECVKEKSKRQKEKYRQQKETDQLEKKCTGCNRILPIDMFHRCRISKGGFNSRCKDCVNVKERERSKTEKAIETRRRATRRFIERGGSNDWEKKRWDENPEYRIRKIFRNRIYQAVTAKAFTKFSHSLDFLGCSIEELKKHLEDQFQEGMTWDNYGSYWEIDHIIPCSYFDLSLEENQYICFNFRNLQPLLKEENRWIKRDKVPENIEELLIFLKKEIYENKL